MLATEANPRSDRPDKGARGAVVASRLAGMERENVSIDTNMNPDGLLSRSHSEYVEGETLVDMPH